MHLLSDLVCIAHVRVGPYYRGFLKENMLEFCWDIRNCP